MLHEGQIALSQRAELILVKNLSGEAGRRIRGLIEIRDTLRKTIRSQLDELGESAIVARQQLNVHYDRFVSRFGPINASANRRPLRGRSDSK